MHNVLSNASKFMLVGAMLMGSAVVLHAETINVTLTGQSEVPPVSTSATGSGTLTINADKSIAGSVKTNGVAGTMAHIHLGKAGENGSVVVPLTKEGSDIWKVPANTKLSDEAYKALQTGGLYINVHSAAHPGGEIRSQVDAGTASNSRTVHVPGVGGGGGGY